jgi:hypothetical protein
MTPCPSVAPAAPALQGSTSPASGSPRDGSSSRPAAGRTASGSSSRPGTAKARGPAAAGSGGEAAGGGGDVDEGALSSGVWGATEAKERLAELLGEQTAAELADAQWKVRFCVCMGACASVWRPVQSPAFA